MPFRSTFANRRRVKAPATQSATPEVKLDLRGLDLVSSYDTIVKGRTPFAHDFRLFAQEAEDRRVAVSSRKGSSKYLTPVGQAVSVQNISTAGASDQLIGISDKWLAMKFIPTSTAPLTRIDLNLKSNNASGPLIVEIYNDSSGSPGTLLASSGILNSSITSSAAYVAARFVEAPSLTSGSSYWVVVHMQDDGSGNYIWTSTTALTTAMTSNSGGLSWTATTFGLNYTAYQSATSSILGLARFTPDTSSNKTLVPIGTGMYVGNDVAGTMSTIATSLSVNATNYYFDEADGKIFWVNGFDNPKYWDGTTVTTMTFTNLPVLKLMCFHQNLMFGISATEPNKLVYSEAPGNDDGAGNLWYNAWLSTSFIYIPHPKANDPITAIVPFQNNLYIFTRTGKWTLFGSDPGSFALREATGHKGAVSQNAVYADENYIYFVAPDGIYRFNGSSDEKISDTGTYGIQPEFSDMGNLNNCFVTKWKGLIRIYYTPSGGSYNSKCLLWHTTFEEWMIDNDSYTRFALPLTDGDDPDALLEASSTSPAVHYGEVGYDNMGKAIDFEYDCNYDNFGNPAQKKRIQRFYPLLEGEDHDYTVQVGIDKDRENNPVYSDFALTATGPKIGHFQIGDGTELGSFNQFSPRRLRTTGFAYYWQIRIKRKAINNPIRFVGYVMTFKGKRL